MMNLLDYLHIFFLVPFEIQSVWRCESVEPSEWFQNKFVMWLLCNRKHSVLSHFINPQWVKEICWLSGRGNCLAIPGCSCICFRVLLPSPSCASSYFILVLFLFIYFLVLFFRDLAELCSVLVGLCVCLCALLVVIITSVSQVFAASTR